MTLNTLPPDSIRAHEQPTWALRLRTGAAGDAGFMLIEVVASAMLVALVAISTMTGFDVVGRTAADQRHHNQAAVLAAQSQEQLRSDPASTLDTLQTTPHIYTVTIGGELYAITQKASYISDGSPQSGGCSATGPEANSKQTNNYIQVSSSVTWPQLNAVKRPPVTQASIITPPTGSTLEVDATDGGEPTPSPVSGLTVLAGGVSTTTGSGGCVVYGGIPSTSVNVEVSKPGSVTPSGAYTVTAKEVSIAPNITTHLPVTIAEGGRITAAFTYKGEAVTGDTFVAFNNSMGVSPDFEVGGTNGKFAASGLYEVTPGTFESTASTPVSPTHYANGNLFPFKTAWAAYAGDCTENNASAISKEAVSNGAAVVTPGGNVTVSVPMSYVELNLYQGTSGTLAETQARPVTITNLKCPTSTIPDNETAITNTHKQSTTGSGHLARPYQPFGKFKLCTYISSTGPFGQSQEVEYEDTGAVGAKLRLHAGGAPFLWQSSYEETVEGKKYTILLKPGNTC